jgi:hypothetical protein
MIKCYAVVFMNYRPLEVDSLWETKEAAQEHIQQLTNPGNWDVCEMEIRRAAQSKTPEGQ